MNDAKERQAGQVGQAGPKPVAPATTTPPPSAMTPSREELLDIVKALVYQRKGEGDKTVFNAFPMPVAGKGLSPAEEMEALARLREQIRQNRLARPAKAEKSPKTPKALKAPRKPRASDDAIEVTVTI